jgi:hypothetical protein
VRRGSVARRITIYGLLQLAFTVISIAAFLPTYFSYELAVIFQIVKIWFPIFYGSRHQCEKLPQVALRQALGFTASGGLRVGGRHHHSGSGAGAGASSHSNGGVAGPALARDEGAAAQREGLHMQRQRAGGSSIGAGERVQGRLPEQLNGRHSRERSGSHRDDLRQLRPRSGGGAPNRQLTSL